MANFILSVQNMCKTQCINYGKTIVKLCEKTRLYKKCVQKNNNYTCFSILFHFLSTLTPPLYVRNEIHISTAPTTTTTILFNNKGRKD